jgi:hypothetical protein
MAGVEPIVLAKGHQHRAFDAGQATVAAQPVNFVSNDITPVVPRHPLRCSRVLVHVPYPGIANRRCKPLVETCGA